MSKTGMLLVAILLLSTAIVSAESPDVAWTKNLGGDDCQILVSSSLSGDAGHFFVGGTRCGLANSTQANPTLWLASCDELGDTCWTRDLDIGGRSCYAAGLCANGDDGVVLVGNLYASPGTAPDLMVASYDSEGELLWTLEESNDGTPFYARGIARSSSDRYFVVGEVSDCYGLQVVSIGDDRSVARFPVYSRTGTVLQPTGVDGTSDGGFLVCGTSSTGAWSPFLFRGHANGSSDWYYEYDADAYPFAQAYRARETADGGFVVAGGIDNDDGVYLLRTSSEGTKIWSRAYGGGRGASAYDIVECRDGTLVAAGIGFLAVRLTADGELLWMDSYESYAAPAVSVIPAQDGGTLLIGTVWRAAGLDDARIVALNPDRVPTGVEEYLHLLPGTMRLAQNYPNPFNPETDIEFQLANGSVVKLEVLNLLGRRVRTLLAEYQSAGSHHAVWDGRDDEGRPVSSGVYFYRLSSDAGTDTKKMVLLK